MGCRRALRRESRGDLKEVRVIVDRMEGRCRMGRAWHDDGGGLPTLTTLALMPIRGSLRVPFQSY